MSSKISNLSKNGNHDNKKKTNSTFRVNENVNTKIQSAWTITEATNK
jgi:hypothetical protein